MDLAAQQRVDWFVKFLADNVPTGHLDPTENAQQRGVRALRVATTVDITPE